ncbi:MAG: hypothetical protein U1E77_04780 [Inhella sp.]
MQLVFPGWDASRPPLVEVPSADGNGRQHVLLIPKLVLAPDDQHRYLVIEGRPSSETGQAWEGHVWSASLGYYGFMLRQGQWVQTSGNAAIAWTGTWGRVGELRAVDLGGGRAVFSAEFTDCGGGCNTVFELIHLTERAGQKVLAVVTASDYDGGSCEEAIDSLARGADIPESFRDAWCYVVRSEKQVLPRSGGAWPDYEFRFSGKDISTKTGTLAVQDRSGVVRLRHTGERYELMSGRSPIQKDLK